MSKELEMSPALSLEFIDFNGRHVNLTGNSAPKHVILVFNRGFT